MKSARFLDFPSCYFKLGHLHNVQYHVFGSTLANDQSLLEAELQIRHSNPRVILTYYNKSIYLFQVDSCTESHYDPIVEFPHLELRQSNTITAESFHCTHNVQMPYKSVSIACMSFLKAVKKMLLYNLSLAQHVQLFGNNAIIMNDGRHCSIAYFETALVGDGDLIVSVIVKEECDLFSSSILDVYSLSVNYKRPADFNHVIYLIPSGIRCHLFEPNDVAVNFTNKPRDTNESLLRLLKMITGTDFLSTRHEDMWWVRLTPNLSHLNNQTSSISDFIHLVNNRKFILWPWDLCVVQLGRYEYPSEQVVVPANTPNPLSLLSKFMDFKITSHNSGNELKGEGNSGKRLKNQHGVKVSGITDGNICQASAADANLELGQTQTHNTGNIPFICTPHLIDSMDFFNMTQPVLLSDHKNTIMQTNTDETDATANVLNEKDSEDVNMDDLFGKEDNSASETPGFEETSIDTAGQVSEHKGQVEASANCIDSHGTHSLVVPDLRIKESTVVVIRSDADAKSIEDAFSGIGTSFQLSSNTVPRSPAFISIGKNEMVLQTPSSNVYNDPGAPLPVMPTPILVPQPVLPAPHSASTVREWTSSSIKLKPKSVFSPITFNPLIKTSIDTKYGKGGKFYVDKDSATSLELRRNSLTLRATSVSGLEPTQPIRNTSPLFVHGQSSFSDGEIVLSDAFMSESSDESDADEAISPSISPRNTDDRVRATLQIMYAPLSSNIEHNHNDTITPNRNCEVSLYLTTNTFKIKDGMGLDVNLESVTNSVESMDHTLVFDPAHTTAGVNGKLKTFSPLGLDGFRMPSMTLDAEPFLNKTLATQSNSPLTQLQPSPDRIAIFGADVSDSPEKQASESKLSGDHKIISESSNYLPLILRTVNVTSIPRRFLLNHTMSQTDLALDIVDHKSYDEWSTLNNMTTNLASIDEILISLVPNLVFDLNINRSSSAFKFRISGKSDDQIKQLLDAARPSTIPMDSVISNIFTTLFPGSYRISIAELLTDLTNGKTKESKDPLKILNRISPFEEENTLKTPRSLALTIYWNCLQHSPQLILSLLEYKAAVRQMVQSLNFGDNFVFELSQSKAKVLKNGNILNLNSIGLEFWSLLGLQLERDPKDFLIIVVGGKNHITRDFINNLIQCYSDSNLGCIHKITLPSGIGQLELEDGIVFSDYECMPGSYPNYRKLNARLELLAKLIGNNVGAASDGSIAKRPLLVLFINYNRRFESSLMISKLFRNFKRVLSTLQTPIMKVFSGIIPSNFIIKLSSGHEWPKKISNQSMVKLALNFYNRCPDAVLVLRIIKSTFSQLLMDTPSGVSFKFVNSDPVDSDYRNDIFLHLCYERSVDRRWVAAAWSDPYGVASHTKAWYCQQGSALTSAKEDTFSATEGTLLSHDIISTCDDIWQISNDIFAEIQHKRAVSSLLSNGKKYLILTRVNGNIPDDELVHWKRLSLKYNDVSLIVLSVADMPRSVSLPSRTSSDAENKTIPLPYEDELDESVIKKGTKKNAGQVQHIDTDQKAMFGNSSSTGSSLPFMVSPSIGSILHSPQQYLNAPGNMWSPITSTNSVSSMEDFSALSGSDFILRDPSLSLVGIIPRFTLPLLSSPSRLSMRVGYLLREKSTKIGEYEILTLYEINILSCSNHWDLNVLMKLLLKQFSRLIELRSVIGLNDITKEAKNQHEYAYRPPNIVGDTMVPWHVSSVTKILDYLVHVRVA